MQENEVQSCHPLPVCAGTIDLVRDRLEYREALRSCLLLEKIIDCRGLLADFSSLLGMRSWSVVACRAAMLALQTNQPIPRHHHQVGMDEDRTSYQRTMTMRMKTKVLLLLKLRLPLYAWRCAFSFSLVKTVLPWHDNITRILAFWLVLHFDAQPQLLVVFPILQGIALLPKCHKAGTGAQ